MAKPLADAPQDQVTPIQETRDLQDSAQSDLKGQQKPNTLLKLGVGVVLILLISITAYLGYQNWQLRQQISSDNFMPTPALSSTSAPDPTANWKTYTNPEFGFEVRYPIDWTFTSEGPNSAMDLVKAGKTISGTVEPSYDTISFVDISKHKQFEIDIFDSYTRTYPTSIEEFKSGYLYLYGRCDIRWGFIPTNITTINSSAGSIIKAEGTAKTDVTNSNTSAIKEVCYYGKTPAGNLVVFSTLPTSMQDFNLFDQILSTFKFIDNDETLYNPTTPKDSTTYSDKDAAYTVQYPGGWTLRKTYGASVNNTGNYRVSGIDITTNLSVGSTVVINIIDPKDKTFEEWVKLYSGETNAPTIPNATYKNVQAYRFEFPKEGRPNGTHTYYQPGNTYIVYIAVDSSLADQATAVQILSTFKFLEQDEKPIVAIKNPADWKIPGDWKEFTATDPVWGVKTTLFLPPGFSFIFSGSDFTIQKDSDVSELWDYTTSIRGTEDGKSLNTYKGGSRIEWYREYFENVNGASTSDKIIDSEDKKIIGGLRYLEVSVEAYVGYPTQKKVINHYLYLQNNIVHILRPASNVSYTSTAVIPDNIATIFFSLKSNKIN